jgi:GT2 family glycosyltransferase
LVVDDGSPNGLIIEGLKEVCDLHDAELFCKDKNEGFSHAVNIGLLSAMDLGTDAVLVNADMAFPQEGWLKVMQESDAAIVGARLLYPNGLIQHAGVFFSLLTREFNHRFRFAPGNFEPALEPTICPVTGALQYIRLDVLAEIGIYDEGFRMGYEDVDFCIRAFRSGFQAKYEPQAIALHYESMFRSRVSDNKKLSEWQIDSWNYLHDKYAGAEELLDYCPTMMFDS